MSKKKFKDTTVGQLLFGAASVINPTLGNVLQGVTSPKEAIAEIIKSDAPADDKIKLQQIIYEQQNKEIEAITSRWEADSMSDSWMSKNVRPLVLVWCIVVFSFAGILDSVETIPFHINELWNDTFEKLKEYQKFRNGYKKRKGINKSTNLNPCKNTQLFEQWIRIEGKTDPEFAYNYMDSFYEKYKPKKHDEWKEINKGLLTTIIEQRDITTTTNENQRPGYEERWEEIVEDDGTYKGMNFEEWKEESIQYNIDNPPSSSRSTERNVGDWEIVSETTEEK